MAQRKKSILTATSGSPLAAPSPVASNWKDHPIAVASIAVAGTIALAVLLVKEVILPIQTAALTNEVRDLKKQVESLTREIASTRESRSDAEKKADRLQSQLSEMDRKVSEAQRANLFSAGNPYPLGLGQVRVGDPISNLATAYPEKALNKTEDGYWSVDNQHKLFTHITYYFDERAPNQPITHIAFMVDYPVTVSDNFLHKKLVEALGAPKPSKRKNQFSWTTQSKVTVFKSDNDSFVLIKDGLVPSYWRDD